MESRRIGIDVDDVLADFHTALMNYYNAKYNGSLKPEDFKTYQFNEVWGGTLEEAIKRVNDFHHSPFFKQIVPIQNSVDAVKLLSRQNTLFVITSRPEFTRKETARWLNEFFEDRFFGISYSSNHYSKAGGKDKSQICRDLGISILVDDSLDYIKQCSSEGIKGVLFGDYPWNQNGQLPLGVRRVNDWKEALEELT